MNDDDGDEIASPYEPTHLVCFAYFVFPLCQIGIGIGIGYGMVPVQYLPAAGWKDGWMDGNID